MSPNVPKYKIAVLVSGGGTSLQNLIDLERAGGLHAQIALVLSSRPDAYALTRAAGAGIPTAVVDRKAHSETTFSPAIASALIAAKVDGVVLAGFLSRVLLPPDYLWKAINIHPALLPDFGGKGMYGHHVHRAVLAAKRTISGCTVHFVTPEYDSGPIILQRTCPVLDADTPDTLAARVFAEEKIALPEAINLLAAGRLETHGQRVVIRP
jgi:phosphoribosylglycinamide formyltransferase 1